MSSSNCCFLTCIQISQRQVRWSGIPISFRIFQFLVIHTFKGFGIVNKAEVDVFLVFSCFIDDSTDVGNLISGSSAFSKSSLNVWNFMVHVMLKPEHCFASMWDECNCVAVWAFFSIAFLSLGLEWKLTFSSPSAIAESSKFAGILSGALSQKQRLGFEIAQMEFHHLH